MLARRVPKNGKPSVASFHSRIAFSQATAIVASKNYYLRNGAILLETRGSC